MLEGHDLILPQESWWHTFGSAAITLTLGMLGRSAGAVWGIGHVLGRPGSCGQHDAAFTVGGLVGDAPSAALFAT